jgi:hypothetical protein
MSKLEGTNRVGRCTNCDAAIYEIKTQYPVGHRFAGEARTVGKAKPWHRVVTLLLMNGHQCNVTMCEACTKIPLNFYEIWRKVLRTWRMELTDDYRRMNNSPVLTPEQREKSNDILRREIFNVPVGIYCVRKLGDEDDGLRQADQ